MLTRHVLRRHLLPLSLAGVVFGGAAPATHAQVAADAAAGPRQPGPLAPAIARGESTVSPLVMPGDHPPILVAQGSGPSLWKHLGVGLLVGAGVGLAVGVYLDSTCECVFHIPVTLTTLPAGAVLGTLAGGVVWLVRRD